MKNEVFRNIVNQTSCAIPETNMNPSRKFYTKNDLLIERDSSRLDNYYYEYAIGIKTGYTNPAADCLVAASKKDSLEFISVVLGSEQLPDGRSARYVDTKSLFEYGYDSYCYKTINTKDSTYQQIRVKNASSSTKNLNLKLGKDIVVLAKTEEANSLTVAPTATINENISAPIKEGDVLGTVTYTVDGISYTANLVAANNVDKSMFLSNLLKIIGVLFVVWLIVRARIYSMKKRRRNYRIKRKNG
jgi:D-alanyl-D-alanine carboxypeptidase (penicillin-binding protein 5/6)